VPVLDQVAVDHVNASRVLGYRHSDDRLRKVDDADAFERLVHLLSPDCAVSFTLPAPPTTLAQGRKGSRVVIKARRMMRGP